jgi:hypothetical protein
MNIIHTQIVTLAVLLVVARRLTRDLAMNFTIYGVTCSQILVKIT